MQQLRSFGCNQYTQLRNGQLVTIPPILVRRLKSHFISLPCDVDLILGLNGYIWVSKHVKESDQEGEEGFDAEAVYSNQNDVCQVCLMTFHDIESFFCNRLLTAPPAQLYLASLILSAS